MSEAAAKVIEFETKPAERHWWSDGRMFWVQNDSGEWVALGRNSFEEYLGNNPFECFRGFKEEGESLSPAAAERLQTELEGLVSYVGPLAGWKKGVQTFEDTRALVTRDPKLIKPEDGSWQILYEFLNSLLGHDPQQFQCFLFWVKQTLDALYEGRPRQGLALVLAGEAGCGKTLLKEFLRLMFGGREVYPYAYMMGKDNFNQELTESPLWVVDDVAAETSLQGRLKFGAEVKQVVANTGMRCRGMHRNGMTLNPLRRLVICLNTEPDRLLVLPPLDDDIHDKMLICKCVAPAPWPMPFSSRLEKDAFFQQVKSELPAFIHHLLDQDIPEDYRGRFGVRHYHHPEVVESLLQISPEIQLAEQVDRALFTGGASFEGLDRIAGVWSGSVNDLVRIMMSDQSPLLAFEKNKLGNAGAFIGRRLSKLQARFPGRYESKRTASKNVWTIRKIEGED